VLGSAERGKVRLYSRGIILQEFQPISPGYLNVTDGQTDGRLVGAYARGPAFSWVNCPRPTPTPPGGHPIPYILGACGDSIVPDVWFSKRDGFLLQKTSALGKPDVNLFIARTDTQHNLPPAKVTVDSTQLKAGNLSWQNSWARTRGPSFQLGTLSIRTKWWRATRRIF